MTLKNIVTLNRKKNLYLQNTETKGRGVFCTTAIREGEELEVTPALILNEKAHRDIDNTILSNYVFITGSLSKMLRKKARIKNVANSSSVLMGIASFCNHDERPNAEILWEEREGTLYYILRATRNIPKNTEICTSYGRNWFDDRK